MKSIKPVKEINAQTMLLFSILAMISILSSVTIYNQLYFNQISENEKNSANKAGYAVVAEIEKRIDHNTNISMTVQKQNQELLQDIKQLLTGTGKPTLAAQLSQENHELLEKILNQTKIP